MTDFYEDDEPLDKIGRIWSGLDVSDCMAVVVENCSFRARTEPAT